MAAAAVNICAPVPAFSIVQFPPAATLDHNQVRQILKVSMSTYITFCDVTRQKFERDRQKQLTPNILCYHILISRFDQIIINSVWNFARRQLSVSREDFHYFDEQRASLNTSLQHLFRAITITTRETEGELNSQLIDEGECTSPGTTSL
jgi:hypothetical protein